MVLWNSDTWIVQMTRIRRAEVVLLSLRISCFHEVHRSYG